MKFVNEVLAKEIWSISELAEASKKAPTHYKFKLEAKQVLTPKGTDDNGEPLYKITKTPTLTSGGWSLTHYTLSGVVGKAAIEVNNCNPGFMTLGEWLEMIEMVTSFEYALGKTLRGIPKGYAVKATETGLLVVADKDDTVVMRLPDNKSEALMVKPRRGDNEHAAARDSITSDLLGLLQ